jgi:hypothetical protein
MAKIAGELHITVDGNELDISGAVSIPLLEYNREAIVSLNGNVHNKKTPIAPYVEGEFLVYDGFPLSELQDGEDMTVVVSLANGMTYTLSGAFIEGEAVFESDGATVSMKFTGTKGRWS